MKKFLGPLTFGFVFFTPRFATAGEGLFSRVYTVETVPEGHGEVEQTVRNRFGRAFGSYSAYDLKTELEYGVTDKLQAALYLNTGYVNAQGAPDDDDPNGATGFTRSEFFLDSVSAEFIYRVLSPVTDPIGLAFYIEPEVSFYDFHDGLKYDGAYATEYRVLLQKNFMEDQLIVAFNTVAEIEFLRFQGGADWKGELDWNNELGATYRVASNWYAGLEARNHNEIGDFAVHEHSVYWMGPVAHYGGARWWGTLGVLRQVYGVPNGYSANGAFIGDHLFLRSHEKWEVTAKIGFPF